MSAERDDRTAIGSIAVTAGDVVAALEARRRTGRRAVLRVTPPFSARMRARLHVAGREAEYGDPRPVHLHPDLLVGDVPGYPAPTETAEPSTTVTRDPDPAASVDAWRTAVRGRIVDAVTLPGTDHRVRVVTLGTDRPDG